MKPSFSQQTTASQAATQFCAVAIGRNEGERLEQCLTSLSTAGAVVYVDSGSTDDSIVRARGKRIDVIKLDATVSFTAARARNVGFRRLRETAPELAYIQFIDGDCELMEKWPQHAVSFLETHPEIAAVYGRLRERFPKRSIYNWLCDREWDGPAGEVKACGGIVMMRSAALAAVGGFLDALIAGEEPEVCVRLRKAGWRIWRLDTDMAFHDAAMTYFSQWWRRALRSGYAFAQGVYLHGASPEKHRIREWRRAWFWGIWLPVACIAIGLAIGPWGWTILFIYPLQVLRQTLRNHGSLRERMLLALFQTLSRFPEAIGQVRFLRDRLLGRPSRIIEYK